MSSYATRGSVKQTSGSTIALTISNAGAYLLVFVYGSPTSVDIGGSALANIASLAGTYPIKVYGVVNPPTGSQTVTINGTGWTGAHALVFDNCGAAEMVGSHAGAPSSISVSPSANNSDMYVDCVIENWSTANADSTFTAGAGQTAYTKQTYGATSPSLKYPPASAASHKTSDIATTMSWTFSQTATGGAHIVMALIPYHPRVGRGYIFQ